MKDRNITLFVDIINESITEFEVANGNKLPDDHTLNSSLESEVGKSLLFVAIEGRKDSADYLDALLRAGVSPNKLNQELNIRPLHFAAKQRNAMAMEKLLQHGADVNSIQNNGRTALHICAEAGYKEGVDILLNCKNVEINLKDNKGKQTPLYLAVAKNGSHPIVTSLLEHGADLDHICFKRTIREHIQEKMPGYNIEAARKRIAPIVRQTSNSAIEELGRIVDEAGLTADETEKAALLEKFQSITLQLDVKEINASQTTGKTLLQKVCEEELPDFAKVLLEQCLADPNLSSENTKMSPVLIAANRGDTQTLKVLLEHNANVANAIKVGTDETILHLILKKDSNDPAQIEKWHNCLLFLIGETAHENDNLAQRIHQEVCMIVNKRDILSNTALHYATQRWSSSIVRALLEHGANIGMKNKFNDVPIQSISPETMEEFLDEHCLRSNYNTKKKHEFLDIGHSALEITFDYSFLAPSNEDLPFDIQQRTNTQNRNCKNAVDDEESQEQLAPNGIPGQTDEAKYVLPETDSLWLMAQSKEHRHLLKHPVITSFLWLKWARIRRYFNRNLRFYLLFVFVLTWYIFYGLDGARKTNGLSMTYINSQNTSAFSPAEKQLTNFFYGAYIFFVTIMIIFILRDWRTDIIDICNADKVKHSMENNRKPMSNAVDSIPDDGCRAPAEEVLRVILSNWVEVALIIFMVVLIIVKEHFLWLAMLILLSILVIREGFQLTISLRRYILSPENWIEVSMIILISILLFLEDNTTGIDIKRHMAAFAIVLSWAELITLVGKHPKLSRFV